MPRFDRVAMPDLEQFSVGLANGTIDPSARALTSSAGAPFDHAIEIAIELYVENALSDRFLEAFGNMEAIEGITPRLSGRTQKTSGSSASSAMGNIPVA